jgi:hypothetical protein
MFEKLVPDRKDSPSTVRKTADPPGDVGELKAELPIVRALVDPPSISPVPAEELTPVSVNQVIVAVVEPLREIIGFSLNVTVVVDVKEVK